MTDLSGISKTDCPSSCNGQGCTITGGGICAHPCKSGVQYADKKPETLARYAEACQILGVHNQHEVSQ
ncbi:hypothetical protein IVA88_12480 [Bradyrhizobium sp. 149]|uniref:hypothetical protein n=1 Tax=Bradyrhizobium sp. 149 TaxID=2782624 RepID=UPI001FF94D6C|nr:hypothetical protein [Bradyrhizobium sp. 149]MCK1652249.1 hypothetical protein [Bradyrhizobium sp. 149]